MVSVEKVSAGVRPGRLALQFSVLVLEGVGGVISRRRLLPRLLFGGVEWTSLLGGLKSVRLGTGAGPAGTKGWTIHAKLCFSLTISPEGFSKH